MGDMTEPAPGWRDDFTGHQQPRPAAVDDLSRFVLDRISAAEDAPSYEFPDAYNRDAGPIAHRYAAEMRRDMAAFRRIVELYCEAAAPPTTDPDLSGLETVMFALAARWSDHPDFRDEWRLE